MKIIVKIIVIIFQLILGITLKWPLQIVTGSFKAIFRILNGIVLLIEKEVLNLGETKSE